MSDIKKQRPVSLKDAVGYARNVVSELFEGAQHVGLEEVTFDEAADAWEITIGFARPWDFQRTPAFLAFASTPSREYKVVTVDASTGAVRSVLIRKINAENPSS